MARTVSPRVDIARDKWTQAGSDCSASLRVSSESYGTVVVNGAVAVGVGSGTAALA
jgi:hypothetical protein